MSRMPKVEESAEARLDLTLPVIMNSVQPSVITAALM